jgi:hypothetical protein
METLVFEAEGGGDSLLRNHEQPASATPANAKSTDNLITLPFKRTVEFRSIRISTQNLTPSTHFLPLVCCLGNHGVMVFIGGGATAEKNQVAVPGVPNSVFEPGRNGNGVPHPDVARFAFDSYPASAGGDEINLLGAGMVVFQRATTDRNARLGEALIADCGIPVSQQFPNFRTIPCDERWNFRQVF